MNNGTRRIARELGVTPSDVSNMASGNKGQIAKVAKAKQGPISEALKTKKAELVRRHLLAGKTITPLESLNLYGLHALGQTITRLKKTMDVRNIVPEKEQNQRHAIYQLFTNKSGEPK